MLKSLHWLPVAYRIQFKILIPFLLTEHLHSQAPVYVAYLLHPYSSALSLRSNMLNLLSVPGIRLKICGDQPFEAIAPKLWNALPTSLQSADSVDSFKRQLKTHLFGQAFLSKKIARITTDNASNHKKVYESYIWIPCFGHNLHLAVG